MILREAWRPQSHGPSPLQECPYTCLGGDLEGWGSQKRLAVPNSCLVEQTLSLHVLPRKTWATCQLPATDFSGKLAFGTGEMQESWRQNNSAQDFESSIWHVSYPQLSMRRWLGNRGLCPWRKGLFSSWRQETTDYSRLPCQGGRAPRRVAHTAFPNTLGSWASLEMPFQSCSAVAGIKWWAASSV